MYHASAVPHGGGSGGHVRAGMPRARREWRQEACHASQEHGKPLLSTGEEKFAEKTPSSDDANESPVTRGPKSRNELALISKTVVQQSARRHEVHAEFSMACGPVWLRMQSCLNVVAH